MTDVSPFEEWKKSEPLFLSKEDLNFLHQKINDEKTNSKIEVIPEGNEQYRLRATSWIGTIKIPSHTITIKPKIGNLNFFKMLAYSENLGDIRFLEKVKIEEGKDLVDFMAKLFVESVQSIIEEGIYKNYVTITEEIPTIKGKLLIVNNIRKPRISQEKFWCAYDELSCDTLENQILLYCSQLLSELVVDNSIKEQLAYVQHAFQKEGVSEVFLDVYHLDMISYQRFNEHYEKVLELCEFILKLTWYGDFSKEDTIPIYGFLYNMNTLFQNFITKALQEEFSQFRVKREPKKSKLLREITTIEEFDVDTKTVSAKVLKPDIVIQQKNTGKTVLVIDTKYKKDDPTANDFYQSVAYSLALGCPVMLLLPQLDVRKKGDFELIPELDKKAPIFVRTVDLSEESRIEYVQLIKNRLKEIVNTILFR